VSPETLGKLYEDGEVLIRQGEAGDCMYVIREGEVEVIVEQDGRETLLRVAGKGELLGEMAIFEKAPRSATVRARGQVRALTIDKKNFLRRVSQDPSIAFNVVQTLARRVRELSGEIASLKNKT